MIWQAFLIATGFAAGGASAAQPTTRLDAVAGVPDVDSTTQTEDVQFRTGRDDRLTVPVRLSGTGPYRFLVDTGADRTAVSREIAGKLGLTRGNRASLASISGISSVSTADVPSLEFTRRPVNIVDAPLLNSADMGADGILGVDSLHSQRVMFDFEGQTMSIVPSAVPDFRDEPGTIVIRTKRRHGRLVVTNAVAEGRSVTVVLDTGAQVSMGNEALRRDLAGKGLVDAAQHVELVSVTGQTISGDYMFLRQLEIGGLVLKNVGIVFAEAHTFRQLKLERKPALLLGMNAISAFKKVSIDFANRKFRVVLPEESALMIQLADARRE
jgi:predicted aspartyl protease